jgi:hypothetical protein
MLAAVLAWLAMTQPASDPVELLQRIRGKMAENLEHLPDYTCRMTIERSARRSPDEPFQTLDTVRLEVSYVGGKEMFAFPGAGGFEEKGIEEMVRGGTIGTGSFALHAKSVFLGEATRFTYVGKTTEPQGRSGVQYDFRVPRAGSRYVLRAGGEPAVVGYRGSFRVDAETLDLIRLQVETDDIPSSLPIARTGETMEYGRVKIGTATFLLPRSAELIVRHASGAESRNRICFEGCRQYSGESVIRFSGEARLP